MMPFENWMTTTLGEIGFWSSGSTPSRKHGSYYGGKIPWVKTGDLNDGLIHSTPENITKEGLANSSAKIFPPGTLLIAMYGATIGKLGILAIEASTNQACAALLPTGETRHLIPFVFYYLLSERENLRAIAKGGAQPNISQTVLKSYPFPFPTLQEQKRIVKTIEALQGRSKGAREALEAIPPLLEKFRQSVLSSAFRGDLTADWRVQNPDIEPAEKLLERIRKERRKHWEEDELAKMKAKGQTPKDDTWKKKYKEPEPVDTIDLPELPEGWCWESLERICSKITDGTHHSPANGPEGDYMYLTSKNVRQWKLDLEHITFIDEKIHNEIYARCDVKRDDILYVKDGANTGLAALNTIDEPFSLLSSVGVFRAEGGIVPSYLMYFLNSPIAREMMLSQIAGIAITRLTLIKLKKTVVPIPSEEEQQVISNIVGKSISKADSLEENISRQLSLASELDQSILSKAFRGELVPQDQDDEPASQLLKRIKQEKTSLEAEKKKRGKVD